jgi:hypothetical protein
MKKKRKNRKGLMRRRITRKYKKKRILKNKFKNWQNNCRMKIVLEKLISLSRRTIRRRTIY